MHHSGTGRSIVPSGELGGLAVRGSLAGSDRLGTGRLEPWTVFSGVVAG